MSVIGLLRIVGLVGGLFLASGARAEPATPSPPGEALWQTRCAACHSLYPPPKAAPPGMGIVMHYSEKYRTRDEFVTAVTAWVAAPAKEKSQMPAHAIERFGVMPSLQFPPAEVKLIAAWLWDEFTGPRTKQRGGQ